ncbi:hypothetical protein PsorP6_000777 [Peronosclerospora sorghi]|uniref:Uncharacterized protein n=1 Tax=Peronosclerospora sorghi TaxID=230839 RepID=A0ACC0WVC7_9STRA|nr:hypothetical protein PsorP6_000777 [Peronosclerospora sorghi]
MAVVENPPIKFLRTENQKLPKLTHRAGAGVVLGIGTYKISNVWPLPSKQAVKLDAAGSNHLGSVTYRLEKVIESLSCYTSISSNWFFEEEGFAKISDLINNFGGMGVTAAIYQRSGSITDRKKIPHRFVPCISRVGILPPFVEVKIQI